RGTDRRSPNLGVGLRRFRGGVAAGRVVRRGRGGPSGGGNRVPAGDRGRDRLRPVVEDPGVGPRTRISASHRGRRLLRPHRRRPVPALAGARWSGDRSRRTYPSSGRTTIAARGFDLSGRVRV